MGMAERITKRFVDVESPDSASTRWRTKRWFMLAERFPDLDEMRVLDLGGTVQSWRLSPQKPAHLTLLNMFAQSTDDATVVVGDACNPPASLLGEHFDLVYANSVIEHVGGHYQRERFAETVHSLGEHHWVQTPNRLFPIEPHFVCPMFQYLPLPVASRVLTHWPLGNAAGHITSLEHAASRVQSIELLSPFQVRHYFPTSLVLRERLGPLTKSLIACR
jgi:hypothetical protein